MCTHRGVATKKCQCNAHCIQRKIPVYNILLINIYFGLSNKFTLFKGWFVNCEI